jgi:hypothetical protein
MSVAIVSLSETKPLLGLCADLFEVSITCRL